MLGLLKFPDDFSKSTGLIQLWYKDNGTETSIAGNNINIGFVARHGYVIQKPDLKGTFSFRIPLKHIFGFCDDYEKIVYGFKHQLTLVRKGDKNAIFRAAAADAGKVALSKRLGICHMWLQICKKNLHSKKQLNQNQVSQAVTE